MPATPPLRGDSGAPMRGGMRPGASMLCRPDFHTSGQGPSSGLQASPYPGARGSSPQPPAARRPRLPARPRRRGALALAVPAAHERDAAMLHGFVGLDRPSVHRAIWVMAHLGDTLPYACAGLLCIAVALARRRGWRALAAAACWR